jgi:hypothetical protein
MSVRDSSPMPEAPPPGGRIVTAVFDRRSEGEAAVEDLRRRGWPQESLGLLHQPSGTAPHIPADETKATQGLATGAAIGGAAGLALGLTALAVPGIGPVLAAGPIAAGLAGLTAGGGVGALVGSFAGLGMPDQEARHYEAAVREGGFFVSVSTRDQEEADLVCGLLGSRGARDVSSYDPKL